MLSYNDPNGDRALDYTKFFTGEPEPPILDLSCKKAPKPYSRSPRSSHASSLSPPTASASNARQKLSFPEGPRSPCERRRFMETPPSDLDSPKKFKCLDYPSMGLMMPDITERYPLMPMSLPLVPRASSVASSITSSMASSIPSSMTPSMPPMMPPFLANQTGGTMEKILVPVTSTNGAALIRAALMPQVSPDCARKLARPFKAYPKDPVGFTMGSDIIYDQNVAITYPEFRQKLLDSVKKTNEGTNIKMRRVTQSPGLPTSTMGVMDDKDAAYWERRRKNNEAAKRSRDARRAKEDEIAIRAAFLEQENMKLKYEVVALRNETAKLRDMVYSS